MDIFPKIKPGLMHAWCMHDSIWFFKPKGSLAPALYFHYKESLFHSFWIIKSNLEYFTMLHNFSWISKLSKTKQWFSVWFSVLKTFMTEWQTEWQTQYLRLFGSKNILIFQYFRVCDLEKKSSKPTNVVSNELFETKM